MDEKINYKNLIIKPSAYNDDFDISDFFSKYNSYLSSLANENLKKERTYISDQMMNFPTILNVRMNLAVKSEMAKRGLELTGCESLQKI